MRLEPLRSCCLALAVVVALFAWPKGATAESHEALLLDGKVWQQLTPDSKLAFVWGITQVLEFERQLAKETWDPQTASFIPHFVKGQKGKTLNDVVIAVDEYYLAANDRVGHPVMRAIVQTIVLPAL